MISTFAEFHKQVEEVTLPQDIPYWSLRLSYECMEFSAAVGGLMANRNPILHVGVETIVSELSDVFLCFDRLTSLVGFDLFDVVSLNEFRVYTDRIVPQLVQQLGDRIKSFPFVVTELLDAMGPVIATGLNFYKQEHFLTNSETRRRFEAAMQMILRAALAFGHSLEDVADRAVLRAGVE